MNSKLKKRILDIWQIYISENKTILDTSGKEILEIDSKRIKSIREIFVIIECFDQGELDIHEFKTALDSYNKRNNLWGFTAIKGQMFFNQLVRTYADGEHTLTKILKEVISEP